MFKRKGKHRKDKGGGFTHFLSLPLATSDPALKQVYTTWRTEVLEKRYPGLPDRCLINPNLLHITLLMLPLAEAGKLERARTALAAVEPQIKALVLSNNGLKLEFDGLEIFGGGPEEARVVFL